jgi:O-antigen ligase
MKSKSNVGGNSSILWWILGGSALVTLYFNSKIQDPFNSPKMWIIMLISAWLVGHLIFRNKIDSSNKIIKAFNLLAVVFSFFLLIAAAKTDLIYTAFFGENQRRNGFFTYLSLVIFMLSAANFIKLNSLKRLNYVAFTTGSLLAAYGLMQISGIDFIKWNNPYNAIISTVGNPNFAAAIMAMMASIIFGPVLNKSYTFYYRLVSLLLTILLLITIYLSDARQGLIAVAIGIGTYVLIWMYAIKSKLRHFLISVGAALSIFSVLGMLQIGPLTSLLYKNSVTVRGYYWRAGIEMFVNNPIFGVGIDRYGAYFKEYREIEYPLNYGFSITSSNAHNVPIQIFATGGIFVGLTYLALLGFILWRGIIGIKNNVGTDKLFVGSIFSAWLAYQAQSIISIDNIGISIWGWVLGGAVVGLSIKSSDIQNTNKLKGETRRKIQQFNFKQSFMSSALALAVTFLVVPLYQGERNMFQTRTVFNPNAPENKSYLFESAYKTVNTPLIEPAYKVSAGSYLAASGFAKDGMNILKESVRIDKRNLDALMLLSEFNEQMSNFSEAITYRLEIAKYDPWNAANYLQLGRNYKVLGDVTNMNAMREKINSFAAKTQEANQANSELI